MALSVVMCVHMLHSDREYNKNILKKKLIRHFKLFLVFAF